MTLHKKTLIALGLALACMVIVLYFVLSSLLLDGFSEVEDEQMRIDVERAVDTYTDDLDFLSSLTRDWAAWDDTYEFIVDRNEEYIESNISVPESWILNRIDVMIYIDAEGEIVFGNGFDFDEEEFVPVPEELLAYISQNESLLQHQELEGQAGLILLAEDPIMLSSQPIITSEEEGPVRGSLIWGRFLNDAEVSQLASVTHSSLTIERYPSDDLPADFANALPALSETGQITVTPLDDEVIAGYAVLDDIHGEPAMILRVDEQRVVHQQGQTTMQYIVYSIVLVGLLFGALTIFLLERFVLSRVSGISSEVSDIEISGDHTGRIKVNGNDELSNMAGAVNRMLAALEETQKKLRKSHTILEQKVEERTEDLANKVALLKTLAEVGSEIMVANEVEPIANLVCRRAADLFHVPKVLIAIKDNHDGSHIAASYGLADVTATQNNMNILLKQGFFDSGDAAGQDSFSFKSFATNKAIDQDLFSREQIKAAAIAPLIAEGKVLGAIFLFDTVSRSFARDTIQALELLAGQVASAIDAAHLLREEQLRRDELTSLYDLSRQLADTAPDINMILGLVSEHAVHNLRVTFARFALIENDKLVGCAAFPRRIIGNDMMLGRSIPLSDLPFCQKVLRQKTTVVLEDDYAGLSDTEREMLFLETAKSICIVPLNADDGPLGLLVLGEAREPEREPLTPEKLHLASSIGDQTASTLRRAELFSELEKAYLQTVLALANAVDAKDTYTADHGSRLAEMAVAIGNRMELSPRQLDDMKYGALLHDVGKIGIADAILLKPAKLTDEEWHEMRKHPEIGAQILAPVPFLVGASRVVKHHHERVDGGGYPDGLVGDMIPIGARILAVVDSYCAIRDKRVYKDARSHEEAVAELLLCSGQQFDTKVVAEFMDMIENNELDIEKILAEMNGDGTAGQDAAAEDGDTEAA